MADEYFLDEIGAEVNDLNNVVTYKSLSLKLKINPNLAKQMLFAFKKQCDEKNVPVAAIYLLGGRKEGSEGMAFELVEEGNLDEKKAEYQIITSEHIYSLQKQTPKDVGASIFAADYEHQRDTLGDIGMLVGIRNKSVVRRGVAKESSSKEEEDPLSKLCLPRKNSASSSKGSSSTLFGAKKPSLKKKSSSSASSSSQGKLSFSRASSTATEPATSEPASPTKAPIQPKTAPESPRAVIKKSRKQAKQGPGNGDGDGDGDGNDDAASREAEVVTAPVRRQAKILDDSDDEDEDEDVGQNKGSVEEDNNSITRGAASSQSSHETPKGSSSESSGRATKVKGGERDGDGESATKRAKKKPEEPGENEARSTTRDDSAAHQAHQHQGKLDGQVVHDTHYADDEIKLTKTIYRKVKKRFRDEKGYTVTKIETVEEEVPLTPEEVEKARKLARERKEKLLKREKADAKAKKSGAGKQGPSKGRKQSSLMSFFKK